VVGWGEGVIPISKRIKSGKGVKSIFGGWIKFIVRFLGSIISGEELGNELLGIYLKGGGTE